jgi:predicted HAD superfamily Cof-like phosphohydrolase
VDVLDLLADLMVYVASEAAKFGILPDHLPWFYGEPYMLLRRMDLEVVTEKIAYIHSVVVNTQQRAAVLTRLRPQESMRDEFAHVFDTVVQQVHCCCFDFGVNLAPALWAVMQANKSKLGADGKPIYDENGKFLKGPNTWKPEGMIRQIYTFG